jgi:hypothetical protein
MAKQPLFSDYSRMQTGRRGQLADTGPSAAAPAFTKAFNIGQGFFSIGQSTR